MIPPELVENAYLYNELGQKVSEGIIDEQGRRIGAWIDFYPIRRSQSKRDYQNNQRSGTWTFYYRTGGIEQKGRFERGRYQGLWTLVLSQWKYLEGRELF